MPNRIIRDGILTSERVERLSWAEEVFYRRVMSVVDDFGRYFAKPALLRAACYPLLLQRVSDSDIEKWLTKCVEAALVRVYPAQDGKRYLELLDFRQQQRATHSKFPAYDEHLHSKCIADDTQMISNAHLVGDGDEVVCEGDTSSPRGDGGRAGDGFDEFWKVYPRKVGKGDARKSWIKSQKERPLIENILRAVRKQCQSQEWQKERGAFIPHPSTWLNQGRWDDGGLDYAALSGRTISKPLLASEIALPVVDEDAAFAWRVENYPMSVQQSGGRDEYPFSAWPPEIRAQFLASKP